MIQIQNMHFIIYVLYSCIWFLSANNCTHTSNWFWLIPKCGSVWPCLTLFLDSLILISSSQPSIERLLSSNSGQFLKSDKLHLRFCQKWFLFLKLLRLWAHSGDLFEIGGVYFWSCQGKIKCLVYLYARLSRLRVLSHRAADDVYVGRLWSALHKLMPYSWVVPGQQC